jgi:hypothetical protein
MNEELKGKLEELFPDVDINYDVATKRCQLLSKTISGLVFSEFKIEGTFIIIKSINDNNKFGKKNIYLKLLSLQGFNIKFSSNIQPIIDSIYSVFTDSEIKIIFLKDEPPNRKLEVKVNKGEMILGKENLCSNFIIENDKLIIEEIKKCTLGGSAILKKLDDLAQIIRLNYIVIDWDDSRLFAVGSDIGTRVPISLAYLDILSTGISWYNKYGYKQTNSTPNLYEEETAANTKYIEGPINGTDINLSLFDDSSFPKTTIQAFFMEIKQALKSNLLNYEQLKEVSKFIKNNKTIKYTDRNLIKKVDSPTVNQGKRSLISRLKFWGGKRLRVSRKKSKRKFRGTNKRRRTKRNYLSINFNTSTFKFIKIY